MAINNLQLDIKCIDGKTTGEKYSIINNITKKAQENQYSKAELDSLLKSEISKDKFSKIVYVNLVNYTKDADIVVKLLKSEDDQLISNTISKCFFWAIKEYSPDFYVSNIFVYISYSNRLCLFEAMAKNCQDEERAQVFYEEFKKSYGLSTAKIFLLYCSSSFVLENLNRGIVLTCQQLKKLLPKKSKFVLEYLRKLSEMTKADKKVTRSVKTSNYERLIRELMVLSTDGTIELIEDNKKFCPGLVLGRNLSRRFLKAGKQFVIGDPKYYINILKKSSIYRYLSNEEYEVFYKGLFPEKYDPELEGILYDHLDYYKKNDDKLKLLLSAYKGVFGEELLDDPENLSPKVMRLLDTESRVKFAEKKIAKGGDKYLERDEWVCYLTCDVSIPKFMDEVYITPESRIREKYLEYMLKSCGINDDMSATLNVLTYFNQRHRNELREVRSSFVYAITQNINLDKFDEKHWEQINELFDIISLNKEFCVQYYLETLFTTSIKYNLNNNLPITKSIINYIKWKNQLKWGAKWNLFTENPTFEKLCLRSFGELIPKTLPDDVSYERLSFLEAIASWNKNHPDDTMSIIDFPWMIKEISLFLDEVDEDYYEIETLISNLQHDKKADEFFADKLGLRKVKLSNLKTMIKKDPELVRKHMKEICEESLHLNKQRLYFMPLFKTGKLKAIQGFEEYIKDYYLQVVNDKTKENKKKSVALRLLVYLLDPEEFFSIAKPYYPEDGRAPVGTENDELVFHFQTSIAYCLKHFKDHPETFKVLKRFCNGDYLKLTVGSLNSICTKTAFYKSMEFLNSCIDTPVSFKKHIIRLQYLISDKAYVTGYLKKLWTVEKNPSILQNILKYIFDLFTAEPDAMTWSLIKGCIETLNSKDKFTLNTIISFNSIPDDYFSDYIELCWAAVIKIEKESDYNLNDKKVLILSAVNDSISLVSQQFVENLLTENILRIDMKMDLQSSFCSLAARYIHHGASKQIQEKRIDFITSKMKTAFESYWHTVVNDKDYNTFYPLRTSINELLENICMISVRETDTYKTSDFVLSELQVKLNDVFDHPSIFFYESYLMLQLAQTFKQSYNLTEFGKNIREILDKEILMNETFIIPEFGKILLSFLQIIENDNRIEEVADGLLSEPLQSVGCALLAINIFPLQEMHKKENKKLLERVIKINDRKVQIHLNTFK